MLRFQAAPHLPLEVVDALEAFHPLEQQILFRQGVTTNEAAQLYQRPSYDAQHDPFLLHNMEQAVLRVEAAIAGGEKITIFSDYDCDGIPGAVVLADFFAAAAYPHVAHYIPHRHYEGFGLSKAAVDKIAEDGTTLIITVDCGVSDTEAVDHAVSRGLEVIITDHHEPKEILPNATAIVNPKVGKSYPFPHLCGAAVAFKLAQALLSRDRRGLHEGGEKWWLDMVGIATLADMVPLIGENRTFAHYGMTVLRKSRRPGLQQLLQKQRVAQRFLTEYDIGFTIGPRINAASRMDAPEDAFHLLCAKDEHEASRFVTHLETLNQTRKTTVAQMTKSAHKKLAELPELPPVLCVGDPAWRPSLVGLVANKLAEEHSRPAFVWGRDGNETLKGSCRAGGDASVVGLMDVVAESFLEYGGHHASGGFSVKETAIHTLASDLSAAYHALGEKVAAPLEMVVDAELQLEEITAAFVGRLQKLGPFGAGNPKPLIALRDVVPQQAGCFGKTKEHTKLVFHTTDGKVIEAIAFFKVPADFSKEPKAGEPVTLVGHVEQSFFMGRKETRVRIVDCLESFTAARNDPF